MRITEIISALCGLAGACGNNPKTANTDALVIKALASPILDPGMSDEQIDLIASEIRAEKFAVSPGCAVCEFPCGNTSDYNTDRIYTSSPEIRELKLNVLTELLRAAASIYNSQTPPSDIDIIYKALSYISYDLDADTYRGLLSEISAFQAQHK